MLLCVKVFKRRWQNSKIYFMNPVTLFQINNCFYINVNVTRWTPSERENNFKRECRKLKRTCTSRTFDALSESSESTQMRAGGYDLSRIFEDISLTPFALVRMILVLVAVQLYTFLQYLQLNLSRHT